jgi:uncharacterized membrane protein
VKELHKLQEELVTSESAIFAVYLPTTPHPTTHVFVLHFVQQLSHDPVYHNVHGIIDLAHFLQDLYQHVLFP